MFAYAGFKILANPASPGARTEAKKMLLNLFGGIALSLGAWVLVDAFMAVLYKPGSATENWYALISGNDTNLCIEVAAALNQATPSGNPATGVTASGTPITSAGGYSYDPGIDAQIQTESAALSSLLSCVRGKLPPGVGRISSISDSVITSGKHTFADCAAQGHAICSHTGSSCHYGGSGKCTGQSYAVDFGDDENMSVLKSAVTACGGSALNEGNHLHASVGAQNGCGCDVGLRGI
jgi:hypothetical protein